MADQKLSQLPNITTLADTDELYVSDGASKALDYSVLRDAIRNDTPPSGLLGFNSGRLASFRLQITNNSGTIQHNFRGGLAGSSVRVSAINNASLTPSNTPNGNNATTNFVNGVKISSANANRLIFQSADLSMFPESSFLIATIDAGFCGGSLQINVESQSINVNGVTRNWLTADFYNGANGASFNLNTTNIPSGLFFIANFFGFLPDYA